MLIKAQKRKATAPINPQNQSAARFEQPEPSMPPLHEVQIPQQVQAPVIQIDKAEIQKIVEIEKQIILQRFEAEVAEKRRIVETEIQSKLEEVEINLANIQKREHEIETILSTEKQNLEVEKAAEQERIQAIEQQLQSQFETAIQQGFEQGYQEAKTNLDRASSEFEEIIQNIHRSKEELLLEIEPQITSIALEVARKILQRESKLDSNLILEQVKSAIKKVTIRGGLLEVSINPEDIQHQTELESALDKMLDKEVRLIFKEDSSVSQGSCIIDTQGGQLNANFKIQIESVKLAFEKYFGQEIILIEAPDEEEITPIPDIELEEIQPELEAITELEEIPLELEAITELEEIPLELEAETETEALQVNTVLDSKIEINSSALDSIVEFEPAVLDANSESASNLELETLLELKPESTDNQFIFESAVDAQSQQNSNEAFSADALALMSELDSAFNQKNTNNSTDEYVDLDTLDAELESVLNEDVSHIEIEPTEDLSKTASSSEIKDDIEIKDHNEIKNPSKIEDINSENLQALFAADSAEAITEHPDNQLIFESITSTLNQNHSSEAFSADALQFMNELDSAFNQKHISNSADEHINLETLDAELESVFGEEVNHVEIEAEDLSHIEIEPTEDLSKTASSSEIKDDIEIKDHSEIKNPSKIEDINLEDLQALFAADSDEAIDEETNADLDFILDQLKENTPIDLENDGSNESKVIEETDELDKIMDKSDLDKLGLSFDLESPNEEDLEALEESMDALLTEVEGEDTDELEALLGTNSIKFNFSEDDDEDELPEIVIDELAEDNEDDKLPEIIIDELEDDDDEVITNIADEEEIDFSENPKKDPVFEEFDEAYDDDYSEGSDPRFPDY
jgi:flagellar assembly protein FliH